MEEKEILQDTTDGDKCLKCPDLSLFETYGGSCVASKCTRCMIAEKKRLKEVPNVNNS